MRFYKNFTSDLAKSTERFHKGLIIGFLYLKVEQFYKKTIGKTRV